MESERRIVDQLRRLSVPPWAVASATVLCVLCASALSAQAESQRGNETRLAGRLGPGFFLPMPSHPAPHHGPSRYHGGPEVAPEPDYDDSDDEEKPKRKKSTSAPAAKRVVLPIAKDVHPQESGSREARSFLLQVAIGIPDNMVDSVWKDPLTAEQTHLNTINERKRLGAGHSLAEAYFELGRVYFLMGRPICATTQWEKALELSGAAMIPPRGLILNSLGAAAWSLAEYGRARAYYESALASYEAMNDPAGIAEARNNLAVLDATQGNLIDAESQYRVAAQINQPNRAVAAKINENLGDLYRRQGLYPEGEAVYRNALSALGSVGEFRRRLDLLLGLGALYRDWARVKNDPSRLKAARPIYEDALKAAMASGAAKHEVLKRLGDLHLDGGDPDRAEPYLMEAGYHSSLGRMYLLKKDYAKASEHFQKLLPMVKRTNVQPDLLMVLTGMGMVMEARNNYSEAEKNYAEAMEVVERLRSAALPSERNRFFLVSIGGVDPACPAKGMTRVKIKKTQGKGKPDQSILSGETARAREFSDRIGWKADTGSARLPSNLAADESRLCSELATALRVRDLITREQDPGGFDFKTKRVNELEIKVQAFVDRVWKEHPEYASIKYPKPMDLKEAALEPDQFVLLIEAVDQGVAVRLLKGREVVKAAFVELGSEELARVIADFRAPFEGHEGNIDQAKLSMFDPDAGGRIYRQLLADVLDTVPEGASLTIIPDGPLALLPYEALLVSGTKEGGRFLGDVHRINYAQSVTALSLSRSFPVKNAGGDRCLVLADPIYDSGDPRYDETGAPSAQSAEAVGGNPLGGGVTKEAPERSMGPAVGFRDKITHVAYQSGAPNPMTTTIPSPPNTPDEAYGGAQLGWPRLKNTRRFGDFFAALFPGRTDVFKDALATRSLFFQRPLDTYKSIVIGTHGHYGQGVPGVMEPMLVFSGVPKGTYPYLRMSDVLRLDLSADVVALAACKSGLGDYKAGEGTMSMGRAFQYAGAKTVLMSLWSVSEDASVAFVESFFTRLSEGATPPEALQEARRELRESNPRYAHPYYWASYILVGEAGPASEKTVTQARAKLTESSRFKVKTAGGAAPQRRRVERDDD